MKGLVLRLLALLGLAPVSHVAEARARAQRAAGKTERLEQQLASARGDAETWKRRHQDADAAVAKWKASAAAAEDEAKKALAAAERARAQAEEWRTRAEALTAEMRALRERLEESARAATVAREQVMATEVKLDLVEAAIHVLDARTRESAVAKP